MQQPRFTLRALVLCLGTAAFSMAWANLWMSLPKARCPRCVTTPCTRIRPTR